MAKEQNRGVYFTIEKVKIPDKFIMDLRNKFQDIVDSDYKFTHLTVSRLEASNYFYKRNMLDKVNLLKYVSNATTI